MLVERTTRYVLAVSLLLGLGGDPQQSVGETAVAGTVWAKDGNPLPGVTVWTGRGESVRRTTTDLNGRFKLVLPAAGAYTITAEFVLFGVLETHVSVRDGTVAEVDIFAGDTAPQSTPVELFLDAFVGKTFTDCGRHKAGAAPALLQVSLDCGVENSAKRRSFVTSVRAPLVDSTQEEGVFGTPNGRLFVYTYDSGACGGAHCHGQASFTVQVCKRPRVVGRPSGGGFECGSS